MGAVVLHSYNGDKIYSDKFVLGVRYNITQEGLMYSMNVNRMLSWSFTKQDQPPRTTYKPWTREVRNFFEGHILTPSWSSWMSHTRRKGRSVKNVNDTSLALIFHQEWFLGFQPWPGTQLLPKEGTVTWNPFRTEKSIPEPVYLLFLFSTTKSWKLQKAIGEVCWNKCRVQKNQWTIPIRFITGITSVLAAGQRTAAQKKTGRNCQDVSR